jgi:serine/threonine protein kinase
LGVNKLTKEKFAIKFFHKQYSNTSDLNYLYKEIDTLKLLDHPRIIKLHNFCTYDEKIVLILEYAPGGNLKGMVRLI